MSADFIARGLAAKGRTDATAALATTTALAGATGSSLVGHGASGAGATTRTVQSKLRDSISVKDYGAQGDNATDDSAAIQAAIDATSAAGGGKILFPNGVYICKNIILKSGVTLTSDTGMFNVGDAVVLKNVTTAGWVIDTPTAAAFGGTFSASIVGIKFQGVNASSPAIGGVRFRSGTTWSAVKNCMFDGFADNGILFASGAIACTAEDILLTNCLKNQTRAAYTGVVDIDGSDHMLSRIEASGSQSARASANLYLCAIVIRGANHFISNCVGEQADQGILLAADMCRIVNCRTDINWGHGWRITGGNFSLLANCTSFNNGQYAVNTYSGFYVDAAQTGHYLANCHSYNSSGSVKYGLEDNSVGANVDSRSSVTNFGSLGHGTSSVYSVFKGASIILANSVIEDGTAGAHTISVENATNIYLSQASAATITNFTKATENQRLHLLGNANVTIQHNGSISNVTGANTLLQGGRIYTYTYTGGSWRQEAGQGTVPGWTAGTGTANKAAFAAYAGATMSAAYVQAEAQASNDAAKLACQRVLAIEQTLRTAGVIN